MEDNQSFRRSRGEAGAIFSVQVAEHVKFTSSFQTGFCFLNTRTFNGSRNIPSPALRVGTIIYEQDRRINVWSIMVFFVLPTVKECSSLNLNVVNFEIHMYINRGDWKHVTMSCWKPPVVYVMLEVHITPNVKEHRGCLTILCSFVYMHKHSPEIVIHDNPFHMQWYCVNSL